ncbi:MAG: MBL fold metallo-hydrolase [Prevotella sp.]|jgi:glyoxylase-like metal-dependent hydrolase (beta-lactamase superfamily II)|nr:MBL fold metallo-hydrolase [Prevotella sp.]MCI2080574.1 MBL fold metallo-hydrolase [Prevotella sp.]MCI2102403.1 MBL fold metallo-hydrolase [Prevotella sp.]
MQLKKIVLSATMAVIALSGEAKGLALKVYNPGAQAIFPVTSTIVYGKKDAALIDAQFQKQYAEQVVKEIKSMKKNLKYVFVSYHDPDYYFGLNVIRKAFPEAKIISTAQTAYLIEASKDMKLDVWKDQLGTDAPDTLIVPEVVDSLPSIEGNALEIKYNKDDSAHPFVWIPSLKAIIGGGSVTEGGHIWMADTQGDKGIERWQQVIASMKQLEPATVVPAHFVTSDYKPQVLDFVEKYLADYRQAAAKSNNAAELTAAMEKAWPQLPGKDDLVFSAKVFKGEQAWKVFTPYPPIGRAIKVDFGAFAFRNSFKDAHHMTFLGLNGGYKGVTDNVLPTVVEVSPNVFMVYWSEPNSTKSNVVHVQNYNTGTVWTNIAAPDGKFYNMQGKMTVVE